MNFWSFVQALTATSNVAIQAAVSGSRNTITWFQATNTGASAVDVILKDGSTVKLQVTIPAGQSVVVPLPSMGIPTTINTALNVALSAVGTVQFNAIGFKS